MILGNLIDLPSVAETEPAKPHGRRIKPAYDCYYPPAIEMNDLLRVDFDRTSVTGGGLFLVEIIKDHKVDWRGCRRFDKALDGVVMMDQSGDGEWKLVLPNLAAWNMRIVGYVEQVYKPSP